MPTPCYLKSYISLYIYSYISFKPLTDHRGQRSQCIYLLNNVLKAVKLKCGLAYCVTQHLVLENLEYSMSIAVFKNSNVNFIQKKRSSITNVRVCI